MAALSPSSTPARTRFRLVEIAPRGTEGDGHEQSIGSGTTVPFDILVPSTQSVNAFQVQTPSGGILYAVDQSGNVIQSGAVNAKQCVLRVALTAAQITTLHSVGIPLIAAQGAGTAIAVDAMTFQFVYGTVQFTGGGAVNPVYAGATANLLGGSVAAATIQAAANALISAGAPAAALSLSLNTGVSLYAATADFAAGNSTAIVTVWFTILTEG
jgi:hypothetical protein